MLEYGFDIMAEWVNKSIFSRGLAHTQYTWLALQKNDKKRYARHVRPSYRSSHFISTISGQSIVLPERKENGEFGLAKSVKCDFLIGFLFRGLSSSNCQLILERK